MGIALENEVKILRMENMRLRVKVEGLRKQLSFFTTNPRLDLGSRSEDFLSRLLLAETTGHTAPYDLVMSDGTQVELKSSRLLGVNESPTKRWMWSKLLGQHGKKKFDFLILMGDVDDRYSEKYAESGYPFVFFLIPFDEIQQLLKGKGAGGYIQITSNPDSNRASRYTKIFYSKYMIKSHDLEERFRNFTAL